MSDSTYGKIKINFIMFVLFKIKLMRLGTSSGGKSWKRRSMFDKVIRLDIKSSH